MHFRLCLSAKGFVLAVSLTLLSGCVIVRREASRDIPLSEAMAAGTTGGPEASKPRRREKEPGGAEVRAEIPVTLAAEGRPRDPRADASDERYVISAALEEVIPLGSDIRSITRLEFIPVAMQDEENYAGLYIGGGDVAFDPGSFPDRTITDTWLLDLGLVGRHYFTPPKTFFSPYVTGGVFGQILFWDYRAPFFYDGDLIGTDAILGGGGFVGLGVVAGRKEVLGFFVEARLGMNFYDNATTRGFYNDVLEDYGYVSVRAGASLSF